MGLCLREASRSKGVEDRVSSEAACEGGLACCGETSVMMNAARVLRNLEELRALTADEFGAQRLAWSPMWLKRGHGLRRSWRR
jgi:hypothetical protein